LFGRVRKWTAMGRPLWLVSDNSWVCPRASMEAAHARLVTWQSTYVLSFACFKLSRNFKPAVVVDCGVSELALPSACTQAVCCQHCSLGYSGIFPMTCTHRRRAWCCGSMEGPTAVMGLLVEPPSVALALLVQEPSRIATNTPTLSCISRTPPTMHQPSTTTTGCTYRRLLSLRRASIVVTPSSTTGFPFSCALHFRSIVVA
jgi:hypothetical protein